MLGVPVEFTSHLILHHRSTSTALACRGMVSFQKVSCVLIVKTTIPVLLILWELRFYAKATKSGSLLQRFVVLQSLLSNYRNRPERKPRRSAWKYPPNSNYYRLPISSDTVYKIYIWKSVRKYVSCNHRFRKKTHTIEGIGGSNWIPDKRLVGAGRSLT